MSRIRSIHPGLWTDEQFVSLSAYARLLFMGMWNECDDKGTFPWSPLQMKMRILPADNVDAASLMAELEAAGCIMKYEIAGKPFGAVRNFAKFQRPKTPNDINPASPEVLVFAGHEPAKVAPLSPTLPKHFPKASEKAPQMEEGEEEIKEEEERSPNGDCASRDAPAPLTPQEVVEEWNILAAECGLPTVRKLTEERKRRLKVRLRQYPDIEDWQRAFAHIRASPFLRGENQRGWKASFKFLLQAESFTNLTEETYGTAH